MPKGSKFVNPLLQRTPETATETSTDTSTSPSTSTATSTFTSTATHPRKRKKQSFEETHERITLWLDKGLKARFEALADEEGRAKSDLLDEAITDVLSKHHA